MHCFCTLVHYSLPILARLPQHGPVVRVQPRKYVEIRHRFQNEIQPRKIDDVLIGNILRAKFAPRFYAERESELGEHVDNLCEEGAGGGVVVPAGTHRAREEWVASGGNNWPTISLLVPVESRSD